MKKRIIKTFLAVCFVAFVVFDAQEKAIAAAPGALDSSFGSAGFVKTNILGTDQMFDITAQPDGKIVAVGGSGVNDYTIIRYLANGALDTTFDTDGIVFVDFGSAFDIARNVQIQSDGKIVVAGSSIGGSGVVRLNPNGSLDTTFDTDGKVLVNGFVAVSLELQSDGKIVLGGDGGADFGIVRLNPNGSLDTTFDTDGRVTTDIEGGQDAANEIRIQTNGRIVAVGDASSFSKSAVVRYLPNGALDTSFSGDGIAVNDFIPSNSEFTHSLVVDPISGAITTVANSTTVSKMLIVSYKSNGDLDTGFSGDGILEISAPLTQGVDVVQQSDRKFIFVGGVFGNGSADDVHLVRINLNGTIDTGFGNNGFVNLNDNGGFSNRALFLVGDKLLIGNNANSATDFGIERVNLSATPTQSGDFDGDGFTDTSVFRPSIATWFVMRSLDSTVQIFGFGVNGDIPIDGDFDGDGRNDAAIYRPSVGQWWFQRSSDNSVFAVQFGTSSDKPVPGDYDKDGKTDIAIFRPSTGEWLILRSSTNFTTFFGFSFGENGDIPITRQGL